MILVIADLRFVLMEECPHFPSQNASQSVKDAYDRWTKANDKAHLYILASMSDILSKKHEIMVTARQIKDSLREMFGQPSIQIKQEAIKYVYNARMKKGQSVKEHILNMIVNFNVVQMNGAVFDEKSQVSYILKSLLKSFLQFRNNKRKGGKEKGPTIAAEGKGKAKETSSFQQLEEGEMTLKVGTGDVISARAMGDAKLGHINLDQIGRLVKNELLNELEDDSLPPCESCLERKMTKRSFTGKGYRAKEPLELIHSDLCGPMNVKTRWDSEYFISFIDDYSRYGYLYLMEYKSETLEKFKEYKAEVENLLSKKIKILRSDRGGEYMDLRFQDYMIKHEIQSQLSAPSTPQQNGVSERRNRTLLDMVHSMMSYAHLPSSFWGYAVETVVHILNNVSSKSVSKTPFKLWRGRKPSLSHFRIWGCAAHVLVTNPKKLEPRSRLCQFVGYPKETRGGIFFNPQENRVFVSTNATFLEEDHMRYHNPRSKLVLNEATDESTRVVDEVGPSSRVHETTTSGQSHPSQSLRMPQYDGIEDPLSYKKAMNYVDKDQWVKAMNLEMESMYFNSVWELVNLPEGVKPIGCKWIYKRKRDSAGKVQTFKARLVVKGCIYDYEIWQMDVKTIFLNGNLEESIFMSQPEGFITQGQEQKVCKLNRSIYGLKQVSRSWNIRFDTAIKSYGFDQNVDEPCVYKKINRATQFQMKDLGEAQYVLGIQIIRDPKNKTLALSQATYIDKMLVRYSMQNSKKDLLPFMHGVHLSKEQCPKTPQEVRI
ncbi:gag/pol protein [Cucumis melo var. makuwa]|uniref:Gag/pol protein n=1 Tax=Cucumis melo var. makuwa TaxID=1194695 RepID=A0A5D3DZL3_CUCMM|nr:gag/pol protein [Cucumis melo var. makuwa]TYK29106.1 gag/pol protein [Cucumis melo var. makuwa]